MFSKTTQPTFKHFLPNYSSCDVKSVVCGVVKNPCHLKVMAFSNNCLLLTFSWERGFSMGSGVTECARAIDATQ